MKQSPYVTCPLCILCNIHTLLSRKEQKMKNKKTSKFLILLMIVTLLIPAFGGVTYAESDTDSEVDTKTIVSYAISFVAANSVRGDVSAYTSSSGMSSFITSKITLQSAPLGSSSYTNVSGILPSTYTVHNTSHINHLCSFPISSSRNYRIKVEVTDKVNGKESTVTLYKTLTR